MALLLALVIALLIVAAACQAVRYMGEHWFARFPRALASDIEFAPGDIIMFSAAVHGFTNSLVTRTFYSHAGVVVRDPGSRLLYVSESGTLDAISDSPRRAGLSPLYTRLRRYIGEAYHVRLVPPLGAAAAGRLWELAQETAPYPQLGTLALRAIGLGARGPGRHCMGHVAWLLDAAGLTPTARLRRGASLEDAGVIGTCRAIAALPGAPLGAGGEARYAPPVHILYDGDAMARAEWDAWTQKARAPGAA